MRGGLGEDRIGASVVASKSGKTSRSVFRECGHDLWVESALKEGVSWREEKGAQFLLQKERPRY
jgi:hypothetical protein